MSVKQMETVELPVPKLSKIPLGHDIKMSFDIGELRQLMCLETYPGDIFKMKIAYMVRFAPLIVPIFHRLDIKFRSFFVPNRLVWDKWQDWITYQLPDVSLPTFTLKKVLELYSQYESYNPLIFKDAMRFDDLDLPIVNPTHDPDTPYAYGNKNTLPLCVFPLRGGNLIWNEYFRHQFVQNKLNVWENVDTVTDEELSSYNSGDFTVGWEKDYFTLATTEPQLGDAVSLPVINNATVLTEIQTNNSTNSGGAVSVAAGANKNLYPPGVSQNVATWKLNNRGNAETYNQFVKAGTINDFYQAKAIQRWKYKLQLAGQRYNEQILAKFGVVTPDYRVQRPEYIGGDTKPVSVGRIINSNGADGSVLGSYAGEMSVFGETNYIEYECEEYGYIHTYMYIVPTSSYFQGIPRTLIKRNIFDYYDPDFSRVGDQEVLNDEIFAQNGDDNGIFGYQLRYSQYKFMQDKIRGEFRTSLSFWHMARTFQTLPNLNSDFIAIDSNDRSLTRVWSVTNTDFADHIYSEFYMDIEMYRPMLVDALPEYITDME